MNSIAVIHLIVGFLTIALSVPLTTRKVKMNPWYGIRIPEAFKSEERWFEINQYGGRLMLWWGISIVIAASIGLLLPRDYWMIYCFSTLGVILGGLGLVVTLIFRHAAKTGRN
jgi:uncharacterized membrane protein